MIQNNKENMDQKMSSTTDTRIYLTMLQLQH